LDQDVTQKSNESKSDFDQNIAQYEAHKKILKKIRDLHPKIKCENKKQIFYFAKNPDLNNIII